MGRTNLQKGFTLTEALVVAAIVAIMAAVAIPTYNGYLRNQRQTTVKNLAETAAVSANTYWRQTNLIPDSASLHLFLPDPTRFSILIQASSLMITDVSSPDRISYSVKYKSP